MSALSPFPEEVALGALAVGDALAVARQVSFVARQHCCARVHVFREQVAKGVAALSFEHGTLPPPSYRGLYKPIKADGYVEESPWCTWRSPRMDNSSSHKRYSLGALGVHGKRKYIDVVR